MTAFRTLERRIKHWLMLRLAAWMAAGQPLRPPDWASRRHRVLILRYDRIGDMILSTGIIKAMALAQPSVVVDVLASSQNRVVLDGNPYVGQVLVIDRRRPWTWIAALWRMRRARYDAVIDVMVMAPSLTTTLVMWLSGSRHRIGLGDRGNQAALTLPVPRLPGAVHYVDHSAALLAAFGVDVCKHIPPQATQTRGWGIWRPEIFLTAAEIDLGHHHWRCLDTGVAPDGRSRFRVAVNVSAGAAWRYWPAKRFIETLRAITAAFPQLQCLVLGAPHDARRMEDIGRACGIPIAHTPRTRDMMAVIATADLVFTADTAVTHVASAFEKPVLAMFARGKADLWGPYAVNGGVASTPEQALQSLQVTSVLPGLIEMIRVGLPCGVQPHGTGRARPLLAARAASAESTVQVPAAGVAFGSGRKRWVAICVTALLLGFLCAPGPAHAGGGPLGIDSRLAYDNSGIWARSNQLALIDGMIGVVAAGALWEGGDDRLGKTFWQSVDAGTISGVAATALKFVFSRERPSQTSNPNEWFTGHGQSFPSGEVTTTSSLVTPFVLEYGKDQPAVYALELLPVYDAFARMKTWGHWQSDVLAGYVLGTATGFLMHRDGSPLIWSVSPHAIQIGLKMQF